MDLLLFQIIRYGVVLGKILTAPNISFIMILNSDTQLLNINCVVMEGQRTVVTGEAVHH